MEEVQDKLGLAAMLADLPKTKQDILDAKEYINNLERSVDDTKEISDYYMERLDASDEILEKLYQYKNNPDMIEVLYKNYIKENDPKRFVVGKEIN